MTLRVPKRNAERPNARRLFPEGTWLIELEEVTAKDPPDFMYEVRGRRAQIGGTPAEQIGIRFGSAEALADGQEDVGNQKLFLDMVVMDGGTSIDAVDLQANDGLGWGILRDAAVFTNLALALGQAFEEGGYVSPSDDFLEQLRDGAFNGHKVIVEVKHNAWKSKDGSKSGVNVDIEAFSVAA